MKKIWIKRTSVGWFRGKFHAIIIQKHTRESRHSFQNLPRVGLNYPLHVRDKLELKAFKQTSFPDHYISAFQNKTSEKVNATVSPLNIAFFFSLFLLSVYISLFAVHSIIVKKCSCVPALLNHLNPAILEDIDELPEMLQSLHW